MLKKLWKKGRRMGNKAEIGRQTEEEKRELDRTEEPLKPQPPRVRGGLSQDLKTK